MSRGADTAFARRDGASHRGRAYVTGETFGCGVVAEASDSYGGDLSGRALSLDRELRQLAREDSTARRVFGRLAGRFIALRGHERLGFARLGDYCAERLGWSGRQFQDIARVIAALSRLPMIERAFERGVLGWSKVRLLASVASPLDEAKWLGVAATTDVRTLAIATASARAAAREQRRLATAPLTPAQTPAATSGECVRTQHPITNPSTAPVAGDVPRQEYSHSPEDSPHDRAARGESAGSCERAAPGREADTMIDAEEEEEERVLVHIACSRRARQMWNEARRLAPRLAGRTLAQWEVAELIAAEASSAPGPFDDLWRQEPWRSLAAESYAGEGRARSPGEEARD